jgi:hypothetical protein
VLELEVLVGELFAVDGLATSAVALGKVATLDHEILDDTVEGGALVAKALLASSKSSEVLGGLMTRKHTGRGGIDHMERIYLGNGLAVEAKDNTSEFLVTRGNIKVDLGGGEQLTASESKG